MQGEKYYLRTLDDFNVGQVYSHYPHKTVTESDNNLFCLLTFNHHPIHSDMEFARRSTHGKILVVGTYVLSLVVGMSVPDISGAAIANSLQGYRKGVRGSVQRPQRQCPG